MHLHEFGSEAGDNGHLPESTNESNELAGAYNSPGLPLLTVDSYHLPQLVQSAQDPIAAAEPVSITVGELPSDLASTQEVVPIIASRVPANQMFCLARLHLLMPCSRQCLHQ